MSEPDKKLSEKLNEYTCRDFWVTAAIWRTPIQNHLFDTYEIGIRSKSNDTFWLLQSSKYNHQSVQEMAEIVCLALDHGYDPEWLREYLT